MSTLGATLRPWLLPLVGLAFGAITPGVALLFVRDWLPVLLSLATATGTALALAVRAYQSALHQDKRLSLLEQHTGLPTPASAPDAMPSSLSPSGPVAVAAPSPASVPQVGIDG